MFATLYIHNVKSEPMVTKPVHCLRMRSESNAPVLVEILYENGLEANHSEKFFDGGHEEIKEVTICKTLSEEMNDKKVVNVKIRAPDANSAAWKSNGILVQDTPGGKFLELGKKIVKKFAFQIIKLVMMCYLYL